MSETTDKHRKQRQGEVVSGKSDKTIVVPAIETTFGLGDVGIPVPVTTCPTFILDALDTTIEEASLAHVPVGVGLVP